MKFLRYKSNNGVEYGLLEGKIIRKIFGDLFGEYKITDVIYSLDEVELLAPCIPGKIVAVGLNYRYHAKELNMTIPEDPIIFLKPPSSIIGTDEKIVIPSMSKQVDYEAELAIVIKKKAKNIGQDEVKEYILGATCLNDVTARDLQRRDGQWTRAKSFDTFCPIGPYIVDGLDYNNLQIKLIHNGSIKQHSRTSNFIWSIEYLVSYISNIMTLEPGDIITTGTPPGVGAVEPDDTVEVDIEGIGILRNTVAM